MERVGTAPETKSAACTGTILLPGDARWASETEAVLSREGWQSRQYLSPIQAAAMLAREPAEAILVTEGEHRETTRLFLSEMHRLWPELAVLLVSGALQLPEGDDAAELDLLDVDGVLPSPVPPRMLLRRLNRVVGHKGQAAATVRELEERVAEMKRALLDQSKVAANLEQACGQLHLCVRNLEDLLRSSVELFTDVAQAERGSVMLVEENGRSELRIRQAKGLTPEVVEKTRIPVGEGVAGWVVREGRPLLVKPGHESPIALPRRAQYDTDSFMSLPIQADERVIGAINLTSKRNGEAFDENDLQNLTVLAHQFGIAMQNARTLQQVESLSLTDALTGLFNRRYFDQALAREVERSRRYSHQFTLGIFDIDYFKEYNDTHGHPAGDAALRQFADVLRFATRATDVIVRYGGEEFAVVFPRTGENEKGSRPGAGHFSGRIRTFVEAHPFPGAATQPGGKLTVSGGLAVFPDDVGEEGTTAQFAETLIQRADERLFRAKGDGRNRIYGRHEA